MPPSVLPVSTYLLNNDCIHFIKRFYEECNMKEQLCNIKNCDSILVAVFGEADWGWSVLDAMKDEQCENFWDNFDNFVGFHLHG